MDLIDRLRQIGSKATTQADLLKTEQATKTALVMPFIAALGYDVFDPTEVTPEFTADVGIKKGEKVDYAVMKEGHPIVLFECKWSGANLDKEHASQLFRYFSVTKARFGILTNGILYRVYSDLEEPNKMDSRPFLEFSITELNEDIVREIKKFQKESFDVQQILSSAVELKYLKAIKRVLSEEWVNPSEEFVKMLASRVYDGRMTQGAKDQFTAIAKRALRDFIADRINERLKTALDAGPSTTPSAQVVAAAPVAPQVEPAVAREEIVTTEDELEAYYIVKSILREVIEPRRVFMRDTLSYCGILLDDNNRKPVCRLRFNTAQKYLSILDLEKNETKYPINSVDDIYQFTSQIRHAALQWEAVAEEPAVMPAVAGAAGAARIG